jgi:hypothetical protein
MFTPRDTQAGVPQGSVLSTTLYSLHINATPQTPGAYLVFFDDDTCIYETDRKEGLFLRKLLRDLSAIETWREHWNIKVNEDKTQSIYFFLRLTPPEAHLTLNGRNILFVNHVKDLGVIFNKRIMWRLHIEMIEAKAFRTFIRICSLIRSEPLSNLKLTLHKALIRSVMTRDQIIMQMHISFLQPKSMPIWIYVRITSFLKSQTRFYVHIKYFACFMKKHNIFEDLYLCCIFSF